VYETTVTITTVQDRESIRGTSQTSTVVTAVRMEARFARYVNVTSSAVTVYNNLLLSVSASVLPSVELQEFSVTNQNVNVQLFTSIP